MLSIPMQMMLVALAGWVNESQLAVIEYLKEEIRVLRELQGKRSSSPSGSTSLLVSPQGPTGCSFRLQKVIDPLRAKIAVGS